jgi:hypothetical protein
VILAAMAGLALAWRRAPSRPDGTRPEWREIVSGWLNALLGPAEQRDKQPGDGKATEDGDAADGGAPVSAPTTAAAPAGKGGPARPWLARLRPW